MLADIVSVVCVLVGFFTCGFVSLVLPCVLNFLHLLLYCWQPGSFASQAAHSLPQPSVSLFVCHEAFDPAVTASWLSPTSEVNVCRLINWDTSRLAVVQHTFTSYPMQKVKKCTHTQTDPDGKNLLLFITTGAVNKELASILRSSCQ